MKTPTKHHRWNGADPVEVAGRDAVFRTRRSHADHFLGSKVGGDEGQSANPCGQRSPGLEEVLARLHVAAQGKPNAQHKDEVQEHDEPVDEG